MLGKVLRERGMADVADAKRGGWLGGLEGSAIFGLVVVIFIVVVINNTFLLLLLLHIIIIMHPTIG